MGNVDRETAEKKLGTRIHNTKIVSKNTDRTNPTLFTALPKKSGSVRVRFAKQAVCNVLTGGPSFQAVSKHYIGTVDPSLSQIEPEHPSTQETIEFNIRNMCDEQLDR